MSETAHNRPPEPGGDDLAAATRTRGHKTLNTDRGVVRDIQLFVDAARAVRTPNELAKLLKKVTSEMRFDHFALVHHVDLTTTERSLDHMLRGEMVALTSLPEAWTRTYVERDLIRCDPVIRASENSPVAFRWDEASLPIPGAADYRVFEEAKRYAGIESGYAIPCHFSDEPHGSAHFAMESGRSLPEKRLAMAGLIGVIAFQTARGIVLQARHRGIQKRFPRLTERQTECVILVGRGDTERQIAKRLGVSMETVKSHLREARRAYEVTKTIQLIVELLKQGHITVADMIIR